MKYSAMLLPAAVLMTACLAACTAGSQGGGQTQPQAPETTQATTQQTVPVTTEPPYDPTEGVAPEDIYYVGPQRAHKSLTQLFLDLKEDTREKLIYIDEGTYDIFREYRDAGIATPPDDVTAGDYFDYNAFLPINTRLVGLGQVRLEFAPQAHEITYGESRTYAPLNILGACYVENLEIYCKNGRYCIHDDAHNRYQDTVHHYKNVRCTYEMGDYDAQGRRLGYNNTIGNGMAQGTYFLFEDCRFEMKGATDKSAFYTHESGSSNPEKGATLVFRRCEFYGGPGNTRAVRLQSLAKADIRVDTLFEDCTIEDGIYLTIYSENSAQHFDVTLVRSGNPMQLIDQPQENRYPIKVEK